MLSFGYRFWVHISRFMEVCISITMMELALMVGLCILPHLVSWSCSAEPILPSLTTQECEYTTIQSLHSCLLERRMTYICEYSLCCLFLRSRYSIGAAVVVDVHQVPSVYSRLVHNPLCMLLYENDTKRPDEWANVSYS